MTREEMKQFIDSNIDKIDLTDAYYIQYKQAESILNAMTEDSINDSPTAATDQVIFVIGNKTLNIRCFNVAAIAAFEEALLEIMQEATEEIYLG